MRSGYIRNEDAQNGTLTFTLMVNNHDASDIKLFGTLEACDRCHGVKIIRKVRFAVLTAYYQTSKNEPNSSACCRKQACLMLTCSYHAIGKVTSGLTFERRSGRILIKNTCSAIDNYRRLD